MDNIRQQVRQFILETCLPGEDPKNLTDETELKESGILDSVSTLKLVTYLETTFGVELEASDLGAANLSTITSIERLVTAKKAARS
jgi:acyl carrier protein